VRILVFHGYLLGGTGSNVYNARLAAALARAGHEVHLLSQDREPFEQDWVDAAGDWDGGVLRIETRSEPARATVYRPDIGGLLPVYVSGRSPSSPTPSSIATSSATSPPSARWPSAPGPTSRSPTTS
jgi:hypothetical protein